MKTYFMNQPSALHAGPRHARHAHLQRRLRAHQLHLLRGVTLHGGLGRGALVAPVQTAQQREAHQGMMLCTALVFSTI